MNDAAMALLIKCKQEAQAGVDYSPRDGAICPWCGCKAKIYRTMPWVGGVRVRYHRCHESGCAMHALNITIKSVQEDPTI